MSSGCGVRFKPGGIYRPAKETPVFYEAGGHPTGKSGWVLRGGADIDYATNPVTGQTQKTLPAVLRDAGFLRCLGTSPLAER